MKIIAQVVSIPEYIREHAKEGSYYELWISQTDEQKKELFQLLFRDMLTEDIRDVLAEDGYALFKP